MKWLDSARARLRLLFARRAAESRMNTEFRFHIEMETDRLMRAKGLAPDEARRQALAAFGGVEKHKEGLRDGRGLAWLSGTSLDVKLGGRMLRKYPGLTLAGGLALAIAIGIGAGWYDLTSKFLSPTIPLPEGDRLVSIETQNVLTNEQESRVVRDFLEWRRDLRTIEDLGDTVRTPGVSSSAVRFPSESGWRSSPPTRSAPHGSHPCWVVPSSTLTKCREHPA